MTSVARGAEETISQKRANEEDEDEEEEAGEENREGKLCFAGACPSCLRVRLPCQERQ